MVLMTKLRILGMQMFNEVIFTYKVLAGEFLLVLLLAYTVLDKGVHITLKVQNSCNHFLEKRLSRN